MLPHPPFRTNSSWIKYSNLKMLPIINNTTIILHQSVPNNVLFISVVTALIFVRSHVNAPFHRLQVQLAMLHQYLLDKLVRVHHQSFQSFLLLRKCERLIDFLLSTNHLRRYLFEQSSIEIPNRQIHLPKITLSILLLPFLFPLTFAIKIPSTTNHRDRFLFTDYGLTLAFNSSSQTPSWHVGCCIQSNQTMCDSLTSSSSIFGLNDSSARTFLFNESSKLFDYRRALYTTNYNFLNNQTLFCERYRVYRTLSSRQLGIFTLSIVSIGIIFNLFVFLVLMYGSLRRSTSFTLFVALTCFDLLSLASSLFSFLFRTVMTELKTSALFCKMFGIFFLYFRQCSSTTLLLIAIERCIVIKYHFCRYIFDKFRLLLLACIMIIYVIPIPFDFLFYTSGALHCEAFNTLHAHRYQIFRGFFTVLSYAMIPFVGISISNILIIIELKKSKKRLITKDEDRTTRHLSNNNSADKRGTTVMLFVASFAFLLLLGPFYIHWCVTYLFHNHQQCRFTRNLYENVQVCMGVLHPYLTVIEKGMRESNHAINFLLYMATSKRFRSDFKQIIRRFFHRILAAAIVFLRKYIWICCTEPAWIIALERHILDTLDEDPTINSDRKSRTAYKTAHYYSNIERRRQNQLFKATLLNNSTTVTGASLSPITSPKMLPDREAKTVRMLTWNPYDIAMRQSENKRQAARLSRHRAESGAI